LHRVLELAPSIPEVHVNMGFALVGLGRHREARDFFASAIELRRSQANAYFGLALAEEGNGDLAAAQGAMRSYLHLSRADDPHRTKARAALWEWEAARGRGEVVADAPARRAGGDHGR
jgi:Flp pilus assembly protein TadD